MPDANFPTQKTFPNSRNVRQIRYDPAKLTLEIDFTSGATYEYQNVPVETYLQAYAAESIGSFVHNHIKNNFQFRKI